MIKYLLYANEYRKKWSISSLLLEIQFPKYKVLPYYILYILKKHIQYLAYIIVISRKGIAIFRET